MKTAATTKSKSPLRPKLTPVHDEMPTYIVEHRKPATQDNLKRVKFDLRSEIREVSTKLDVVKTELEAKIEVLKTDIKRIKVLLPVFGSIIVGLVVFFGTKP